MRPVRILAGYVIALLRELSDQTAYERHLRAHGVEASAEEWRRFSEERFTARFARPKCC
jgi:hypothetical protein